MIDNDKIKSTIDYFRESGKSIRVRDIAYTLLAKMFDSKTAFQCLFGGDGDDFDAYSEDKMRDELEAYLTEQGYIKSVSTDAETGGITFNENKREMEMLLDKTQRALDDGLIEPKDGLKILADIRVKLNDKFKVQEQTKDRLIVVNTKYNNVCNHCGHEIFIPTKEQLMEEYNLVEKQ
jgi:hypothetical protein